MVAGSEREFKLTDFSVDHFQTKNCKKNLRPIKRLRNTTIPSKNQ